MIVDKDSTVQPVAFKCITCGIYWPNVLASHRVSNTGETVEFRSIVNQVESRICEGCRSK